MKERVPCFCWETRKRKYKNVYIYEVTFSGGEGEREVELEPVTPYTESGSIIIYYFIFCAYM